MDKKIEHFLLQLPDPKREIAEHVRQLFLSTDNRLIESIKWGNLTFSWGKTHIAFIYTYKTVDYVNLGFMQATSFADSTLLEGTGKGMRHLKLYPGDKIPVTQIKKWMRAAIKLTLSTE